MNVNKVVTGLLVLLLFLTGCGKQQKIENSNKDGGKVDDSVENMQVQTLYNTRAQWEILDGCLKTESEENIKFSGDYSYAVSDLDNDGNIEIILSGTIENGLDSRNLIFEYCAKDKIVQWDTTHLACKDSEPDFRNQNELWNLKDYEYDMLPGRILASGDVVYYLVDYQSYDTTGGMKTYISMNVGNNSLSSELMGTHEIKDGAYACFDSDGRKLTFFWFGDYINRLFCEDKNILRLEWFQDVSLENIENSFKRSGEANNVSWEDFTTSQFADITLNEVVADDIEITVDKSLLDYNDIDEESKCLYRGFLEGKIKAIVKSSDIDLTSEAWLKNFLVAGKAYSFDEIRDCVGLYDNYGSYKSTRCSYIDCGLDGNYEFLVDMLYEGGNLSFVLKNIDGKVYICLAYDNNDRKGAVLLENGVYEYYWNIDGTRHYGEKYYLDSAGKEHYLYSEGIDCIDGDYVSKCSGKIKRIIYFYFLQSENTSKYCYEITVWDENDEIVEDNVGNEEYFQIAQELLEEEGYRILPDEAAKEMMKKIRREAGITDEVYNADVY